MHFKPKAFDPAVYVNKFQRMAADGLLVLTCDDGHSVFEANFEANLAAVPIQLHQVGGEILSVP